MNNDFDRFGGYSALLVGALSILYAIFFLGIVRQAAYVGALGSWLILAGSGIFSSAAYVALYQRVRREGEGLALWALLLGVMASFATLAHGSYEVLRISQAGDPAPTGLPSPVDPAGLATFFVVGLVAVAFSRLILRGTALPHRLGQLGIFNGILLIVLFFASAGGIQPLILLSGGLTSVVVGPIWWIWLGRQLLRESAAAAAARPSMA